MSRCTDRPIGRIIHNTFKEALLQRLVDSQRRVHTPRITVASFWNSKHGIDSKVFGVTNGIFQGCKLWQCIFGWMQSLSIKISRRHSLLGGVLLASIWVCSYPSFSVVPLSLLSLNKRLHCFPRHKFVTLYGDVAFADRHPQCSLYSSNLYVLRDGHWNCSSDLYKSMLDLTSTALITDSVYFNTGLEKRLHNQYKFGRYSSTVA